MERGGILMCFRALSLKYTRGHRKGSPAPVYKGSKYRHSDDSAAEVTVSSSRVQKPSFCQRQHSVQFIRFIHTPPMVLLAAQAFLSEQFPVDKTWGALYN